VSTGDTMRVDPLQAGRVSAVARLDRLPITSFHRQIMWLLSFVFFFELGSINTFAFAAPAILKAWHLSISTISFIISATFFGMFAGATVGGWFSDRLGRKRALILTTTWFAGFSLLNAFVIGPIGLFLTRFLTGVGLASMTVVGITYISEMYPAKRRGAYQGWIMMIGLFGIPATAYVARYSIPAASWGWRLVFIWGALGLLFPFFSHRLEESPRWYENHGRFADADAVLDRIEARVQVEAGELPPVADTIRVVPRQTRLSDVVAPRYLPRTVILVLTWVGQTLGLFGFTSWVPTLLVAHGFSLVHSLAWSSAMALAAVPGAFLAAIIADHWDRKWWITICALVIAVCGMIYGMSFQTATIIVFGFLVEMFLHTFAPLLYSYTPECYPTEIRNSGTGFAYGCGRLANGFGPLIVAFLFNRYGYTSVFVYITGCWLLTAIVIGFLGPRTSGRLLT
jgi:MFS transporter, putative metabolite:H+ symporter